MKVFVTCDSITGNTEMLGNTIKKYYEQYLTDDIEERMLSLLDRGPIKVVVV